MEVNMAFEISGVDVKSGLDFCEGDMDTYKRVLRSYVEDITEALTEMRNVSENNLGDYAVSVHGVKSTSEAVGAEETRKTAKQLELMAKSGDLAGVLAQNKAFIKHLENLVNNIKNSLEKYGG